MRFLYGSQSISRNVGAFFLRDRLGGVLGCGVGGFVGST